MRCALLHGFAGDPGVWGEVIATWTWQNRGALSVIPLPGHNRNPIEWPVLPTWDENVGATAQLMGDCDVVVGYSLGARVALGLVASGRAPRAVLIGVNPGIDDAERAVRRAVDASWAAMLREQGLAAFDTAWTAQPLFATQTRVAAELRAGRRARRLKLDAEQLARSLEVMGVAEMPDFRPQLPALRDKIALIAGADDTKYAQLAMSLPVASCELIAGSGHDPTLEQPEALAAAIARAVKRLAP